MNIKKIPEVLFHEFSRKLGQGDSRILTNHGITYSVQKLNPAIAAAGFPGAIGFGKDEYSDSTYFVLWPVLPSASDKEENVFELDPVITIWAGTKNTGSWCYGSGHRMREMALLRAGSSSINLKNPAMWFIPLILQRASKLAFEAQYKEFWEKDRDSEGEYIHFS